MLNRTIARAAVTVSLLLGSVSAQAVALRTGFGGAAGYGELALGRNDDRSSNLLDLPFTLNFFGQNHSNFYVNNNGNITFNQPVGTYTPQAFPVSAQPMIAPYWGDVDTTCEACGEVYVAASRVNAPETADYDAITVTWNNVGYFSSSADKTNNFQLTLVNRDDVDAGAFDIEFRYDRLEWTTGGASGGSGGLGGVPAQAGYDAGDGTNFFALPNSLTGDVLSLANLTNVAGGENGLWVFNIRNGVIVNDGGTPATPLLPSTVDPDTGTYTFNFNVVINQPVFIDPDVAVGYRYEVTGGTDANGDPLLITSAIFSSALNDLDGYQVYGLDEILLGNVGVGGTFSFLTPVSGFYLRGIDPQNRLDPGNTFAFVTGLTFNGTGAVTVTQTPETIFVPDAVPEPASWAMMALGFGLVGAAVRRRRAVATA